MLPDVNGLMQVDSILYFNLLSEANFCATRLMTMPEFYEKLNFNLLSEANFCGQEKYIG